MGQLRGPVLVLTEDKLQGGDGTVHPASRIDAGGNGVADVLCRDGLARKAYFFQQSHQARAVGLLQLPQARFDQGSVLPRQGHHVSHRAHGGQVAAVIQHLLRRAAVQRRAELECHARAAQALKRAGVVGPAGIHHGHSLGQHLVGQMVVGDDEVYPQGGCKLGFLNGGNAVVHRDDELAALVVDGLDGVFGEAVAIALPAGQHTFDVGSHPFQVLVEQGRGSHAVHIVVAKDHDGLFVVNGLQNAGTGLVHVGQEHGVGQLFLARQQGQCLRRIGDATGRQNARQQGGFFLLGGQGGIVLRFRPGLLALAVIFQFFGILFRDGVGQLPHRRAIQRLQVPGPVGHSIPSPVSPSFASIPCRAAISLETSSATSLKSLS